ncbi:MAG: hypothetical protein ACRDJI_09100 [Actinomycetota bacterium]
MSKSEQAASREQQGLSTLREESSGQGFTASQGGLALRLRGFDRERDREIGVFASAYLSSVARHVVGPVHYLG